MSFRAVFASPPTTIDEGEFHRWYDDHLDEILAHEGFLEARRYSIEPLRGSAAPLNYRFASMYRIDGDPEATNNVVRGSVSAGAIVHPAWFPLPRSSWAYYPLSERELPTLPDTLIMVMVTTPTGLAEDDYQNWYGRHVGAGLAVEGQQVLYRIVQSTIDEDAPPSTATVAAVFAASLVEIGDVPDDVVVLRASALGAGKPPLS